FLAQLSKFADLVLFTAGLEGYARPLVDRIDAENRFSRRLYRPSTISTEYWEHVKDLFFVSTDFCRMVIVDNNPFSFLLQPVNRIPCIPFSAGQPRDDQDLPIRKIPQLLTEQNLSKQSKISSSLEEVPQIGLQVSTASPNVNTTSPQVSTASFSNNAVYAFMVENPNDSNLLHQDLEQIHEDNLEAMDLKWPLSLLSMRAKRYYQRIGKKIFINANDTAGYDKSKVECFNCHKMEHFSKECRAPRSKEGQFRNQDNTRKQGNNEDTSSKSMLAIDGVGFDWSDMAKEQVQTNIALMAFSDSE
ncbi:ribonuclease H-like domain-containing protein, partial [Tanacetum coccineum]